VNAEPAARHYTSHRSVLKPARASARVGSVDAIVMPAERPTDHLLHSMELAALQGEEGNARTFPSCSLYPACRNRVRAPIARLLRSTGTTG
jgi:hypothetical protein